MKTELHENEDCDKSNCHLCPNMESVRSTWDTETYECRVCGLSYKIYEEDMK